MLLILLLLIPIIGIFIISMNISYDLSDISIKRIKLIALTTSIINMIVSLIIYILFDFSSNQFQFVQEYHQISYFDFYLGIDGLSIYFILLIFCSINKVRASFYLFLYTLLGSLFLLLSILSISSIMGTTDFDALYKTNFNYFTQLFLFYGIFIAFAVKKLKLVLYNASKSV